MYVFFAFHQEIVNIFFEQNHYCPPNYALSQFLWFDRLNNLTKICANAPKMHMFFLYIRNLSVVVIFIQKSGTYICRIIS
jgi:hypothetical protein